MKEFEVNRLYDSYGYDVMLFDSYGELYFKMAKGDARSCIDITVDLNYLRNMDSTETRRLELLFRDLENYAKFGDSEE